MEDKLLHYFDQELAYLRHGMKQFAKRYPGVAKRLNLGSNHLENPYVTRLLESFALISGRLHSHQDEKYDQLNQSLLHMLFPDYTGLIPAMAIVQFTPANGLVQAVNVDRGEKLETLSVSGEPLHFSTCYTTDILPIKIDAIEVKEMSPTVDINVHLSVCSHDVTLSELSCSSVRFFINDVDEHAFHLYEVLFSHCSSISLTDPETNVFLGSLTHENIRPVGLGQNESVLPWSSVSTPSWRLISEYFCFKQKFLFFDITFPNDILSSSQEKLMINFHLKDIQASELTYLHNNSLQLNCIPVVNLFKKTLEPLIMDEQHYQYPLKIDKRYPNHFQIHSIDQVVDVTDPDQAFEIPRLYNQKGQNHSEYMYTLQHRTNTIESHEVATSYLSFTQLPTALSTTSRIIEAHATCCNGNLPSKLALEGSEYHLQMSKGKLPIKGASFLHSPTTMYWRNRSGKSYDQELTSQLAANTLMLLDPSESLDYVRNTLQVTDVVKNESNQSVVDSIISVTPEKSIMRHSENKLSSFVYGTTITVTMKRSILKRHSKILLTEILKRSFAMNQYINACLEWKFEFC